MASAPRIKLCGITSLDDARLAVEAGAWAIGCILWRQSPRACDPAEAARIAAAVRRRAHVCGVFVNAHLDEVTELVDALGLTMVQLHGDEGPAFCAEVARRTGAKVMKAARVRTGADVRALEVFHTDLHLLDASQKGFYGGTGTTWDWGLVAQRRAKVPLILSGGRRSRAAAWRAPPGSRRPRAPRARPPRARRAPASASRGRTGRRRGRSDARQRSHLWPRRTCGRASGRRARSGLLGI